MTPDAFELVLRQAVASGSRRAALGALFAGAFAAAIPEELSARKFESRRKKRQEGKRKQGEDDKRKKRANDRKNKKKKDKQSTSKGCKDKHSEKEILDFIGKAAKKYGQSNNSMVRVARCESSLDPCAYNKSGPYYGLFQFLKSTWKTTPYKDKSIYDPEAQALATGWMWKQGRKNEWACQ